MSVSILSRVSILLAIILLTGFFAYSFMLPRPFDGMDDQASIVENPIIHSLENIPNVFEEAFFSRGTYYRPLAALSFLLEYHFFQTQSFFYNLDNVLLHLGVGILVFTLVILLTREKVFGLAVVFLWMIHPIYWEAVAFVSGRSVLLCAFFFILSFVLYIQSVLKRNFWGYLCSVLSFGLALLSKELAVVFPFIIVSYEIFLNRTTKKREESVGRMIPYIFLLLCYGWTRQIVIKESLSFWDSLQSMALGVMTFFKGLGILLGLFIFPSSIHYDRSIPYFVSFIDSGLLLTGGVLILAVLILWVNRTKIPSILWFALSWSILTLLPVSQVIPIRAGGNHALMAEHFLYLPSVGIWLWILYLARAFVIECVQRKLMRPASVYAGAGFLCALFLFVTVCQNIYAADGVSVFRQTLSYSPSNNRVRNSLALTYAMSRKFQEAEEEYRTILRYDPWDVGVRMNLGKVLMEQGRFEDALNEFSQMDQWDIGSLRAVLEKHRAFAKARAGGM